MISPILTSNPTLFFAADVNCGITVDPVITLDVSYFLTGGFSICV